ncbi:unnamed protein product [Laminaria digitata]
MPTARKRKGVGPSSLSRSGRRASGGTTRSSSRLRGGGGDQAASESHSKDTTTTGEVTAGNALIALSGRSREKEAGPAQQARPEHPVGVGATRPRRGCAPPPGRWSPASSQKHGGSSSGNSSSIIGETRTSAPGGGGPRRLLGQPQAVDGANPGRGESEATGSSSNPVRTTPPEAPHAETTASTPSTPKRAGDTSGATTSATTTAVRRSPRRKEPQPQAQSTHRGRPPKAPKGGEGARSARRKAKSTSAGRTVSTASKGGVKASAWEKKHGRPDPEFRWHEKQRLAVLSDVGRKRLPLRIRGKSTC